uniref:Chitin-binding type-2 domain-containing protein n=1 Tax=Panagrolaimus sp. JU765 TaxID=591449 RepID=A0AC34RMJ4_9BILA
MFEHPSCEHGLAFDERRGRCDYQHNVPGCGASTAFDENSASGCNGHEHGAHVVDQADCNSFYRCVWNQLERMTCPRGTVFNPALSVCDYPDQVPGCSQ